MIFEESDLCLRIELLGLYIAQSGKKGHIDRMQLQIEWYGSGRSYVLISPCRTVW